MIAPALLFQPNSENITDFSKISAGSIFNDSIVPKFNVLEEGDALRSQELERNTAQDIYRQQADDAFLMQAPRSSVVADESMVDYNALIPNLGETRSKLGVGVQPQNPVNKDGFKLSNYGYDSDSSPDTNSNVLRIGHSNNKLEDGVSAALTKSLARRYGLKTGDMFEAVTADGKVLTRRYDDTVPDKYRGRALPETVDLYERKGSNAFGGIVTQIRPIK